MIGWKKRKKKKSHPQLISYWRHSAYDIVDFGVFFKQHRKVNMTTSSEDVLLQMGEVRYKKGDGTLYIMNERIAWMVEHRDTVAVAHKFADIKSKFRFVCGFCSIPVLYCSAEDLAGR